MDWTAPLLAAAALASAQLPAATLRPAPDCYCTDTAGDRVEMGEQICLKVGGRAFLARCEMSLNVPMWRDTGSSCPGS